jgi:hypothetical protein
MKNLFNDRVGYNANEKEKISYDQRRNGIKDKTALTVNDMNRIERNSMA